MPTRKRQNAFLNARSAGAFVSTTLASWALHGCLVADDGHPRPPGGAPITGTGGAQPDGGGGGGAGGTAGVGGCSPCPGTGGVVSDGGGLDGQSATRIQSSPLAAAFRVQPEAADPCAHSAEDSDVCGALLGPPADSGTLYTCYGQATVWMIVCPQACIVSPSGQADRCE